MLLFGLLCAAAPLAAQHATVRLDGQIRLRGEWDHRTDALPADAATLARIRVGTQITVSPRLQAYVQFQDARAWGSETNTLTDASADQLDLHQGWIEWAPMADWSLRLGRQEVSLGDERLVGTVGWTNTGRVFDGALARVTSGATELRAFWMNVGERDALAATGLDPQTGQGLTDDGWFLGAFGTTKAGPVTLEGTLLHDRNGVTDRSWTASLRGTGTSAGFRADATGAWQFGPDRRAFLLSGYVGHAAAGGWLGGQVDYLSGDDTPGVGTRKAFHSLYATNHKFYGYMDYLLTPGQLGEAGLIDLIARASVPAAGWRWGLDAHRFATPQPLGGSKGFGSEIDLTTHRTVAEGSTVDLGASAFRASGGAVAALPAFAGGAPGDWTTWAWAQLTVRW